MSEITELFNRALIIANTILLKTGERIPTDDEIKEVVEDVLNIEDFKEIDSDDLIRKLQQDFNIRVDGFASLVEKDHTPWLVNRKSEIDWKFWKRYVCRSHRCSR